MELFSPVDSSPAHLSEEALSHAFTTVLWSWATGYISFSTSEHMDYIQLFVRESTHRVTCAVAHKPQNTAETKAS